MGNTGPFAGITLTVEAWHINGIDDQPAVKHLAATNTHTALYSGARIAFVG